jgi:16S rRNA (cytosine967-C5)-methyltransferase
MISPSREIAFRVLKAATQGGYATDLLRREKADLRDIALAETIVLGCLRFQSQLDYLISVFSGRENLKLDTEVRIALRMGIYQLRYLDRIPPHAAVAESVELVKRSGKKSATGLVNAVLRKVNRNPVKWPDLATELNVPPWMLDAWQKQYGKEAAGAVARAALIEPEADMNEETGRQQNIGAQTIVPLMDVQPGMWVLDLCAAPGNKTAQMIAAGAKVVACDRYFNRLISVPPEAMRVVVDGATPLPFTKQFDRILVDAPCSGTGTLARNPEIKWRLLPGDLTRFQTLQKQILKSALVRLKPGGRLIYATCSLEQAENEDVVKDLKPKETQLRLPGRDAGDGFFAAVITL